MKFNSLVALVRPNSNSCTEVKDKIKIVPVITDANIFIGDLYAYKRVTLFLTRYLLG